VTARYLIDKSVLARMPLPRVRERLEPILDSGLAATCAIIDLEVLYSARNAEDHREIRHRRTLAYERVRLTEEVFDRAIEVQGQLAVGGRHRIPIPDLVIAAAAEAAGLVVLHYDADFDRIAAVTGQSMEWVVPQGSV
jgi:predicted nucleic acid-binding protein